MPKAYDAARRNNASQAEFCHEDLENPFAEGRFRRVARGVYRKGQRRGQPCVCKWFKSGSVYEYSFFKEDTKAVDTALKIVRRWNAARIIDKTVRVNKAEVWEWTTLGSNCKGQKTLIEPFIKNYQKFNSNTGWYDGSLPWPRVMQALSHYSYHISRGQFVLCDLQGGVYRDGVVLTDPVILSRNRTYGVTDLGPKGISTFFALHRCNEYCTESWQKPRDMRQYFSSIRGTTMLPKIVPTVEGRGPMTRILECDNENEYYHDDDSEEDDFTDFDDYYY